MSSTMQGGIDEALKLMPYGVYVVTAYGSHGEHGATASWVMQISKLPPMIAVALRKDSTTEQIISGTGKFAVNLLPADNSELAERFVTPIDRFNTPPFPGITWGVLELPLLDGAIAWLECTVQRRIESGDHVLLVGEVIQGQMKVDAIPMTTLDSGLEYGGTGMNDTR